MCYNYFRMLINKNVQIKISLVLLATILFLGIIQSFVALDKINAAPSVTITSPTPNQSIPGTSFTVRGTASPNTTIVVSASDVSLAQTKSDGNGNWSVNLTLPAGNINLRAKAIQNSDYGYFPSTPDLQNCKINRLRLSDNVINPGGGSWPIASTSGVFGLVPSLKSNFFYSINPFVASSGTTKFVPSSNLDATPTTNYPANPTTNKGAFSADDSKYYSTNAGLTTVSVIDTATNTWIKDIELGSRPVTTWENPNGKVYVVLAENQLKIINTNTDTVEKTIAVPCITPEITATAIFSKDKSYPYYFVPCHADGLFVKYNVNNDSVAGTLNVGLNPQSAALSLDNKRLYYSSQFGTPNSNLFRVVNVSDGSEIITKTLTAGALGFIATDDFQKIYISTPGNTINSTNIDVVDTTTFNVTPISTTEIPGAVSTLPTETSEASMQVAFVLGASSPNTTTGSLAETGVSSIITFILLATFTFTTFYLYIDYRKHKKPLTAIDPEIHYTFMHHVKMVNLPMLKYRITSKFHKKHYTAISK